MNGAFAMKASQLLAAVTAVVLAGPALAEETRQESQRPHATVRLLSAPQGANRWYGVGDTVSKVQLCVESNTGRFAMNLAPQVGTPDASSPGEIEVVFATTTGERVVRQWDGKTDMAFTGRVAGQTCGVAGNVSLEFRIKQQNLIAVVAGDYINQMRFSVDPA